MPTKASCLRLSSLAARKDRYQLMESLLAMNIRLSQKISSKVKAGKLLELPMAEDPVFDWSMQSFAVGRSQFILFSNTRSLYSRVVSSKGINSTKQLIAQFNQAILYQLNNDQMKNAVAKLLAVDAEGVQFAKALNRSVIGSMNELIAMATTPISMRELTLPELSDHLNDTLLSILGDKKGGYGRPKEAMEQLEKGVRSLFCERTNQEPQSPARK